MNTLVTLSTMSLCILLVTSCGENTRKELPDGIQAETATTDRAWPDDCGALIRREDDSENSVL
jgi:hypothetical protein